MRNKNRRTVTVPWVLVVVAVVVVGFCGFVNAVEAAGTVDCADTDLGGEIECRNKRSSPENSNEDEKQDQLSQPTTQPLFQDVTLHTSKPAPKPKALNMLAEDQMDNVFRPTPVPPSTTNSNSTSSTSTSISLNTKLTTTTPSLTSTTQDPTRIIFEEPEPKGRALNFTIDENHSANVLQNSTGHFQNNDDFDLSDVTIRDDEDDDEMFSSKILAPKSIHHVNSTLGICEKGGLTYENGEKLEIGCDSICTCIKGKMDCTDRCTGPLFRKGKKIVDPLCIAKSSDDPCCSVLVCAGDTETEPLEMCTFENKTYNRGDKFNQGCSEVCTCEIAGKILCKPRCPIPKKTSDRCVEVPDPLDSCCKQVLCDVSLDDHEHDTKDEETKPQNTPKLKVSSAKYVNSSAILLTFVSKHDNYFDHAENLPIIEVSNDKRDWSYYKMLPEGLVFVKEAGRYLRLENSDEIFEIQNNNRSVNKSASLKEEVGSENGCSYKGKSFTFGEEYNDDCEALCVCRNDGMKCLKLECPTYFGVDVLDPNCIEWETIPPNFEPVSPNCCPDKVRCKNNGSCEYEGEIYKNWEQLPLNVTGCDKRCYCEMGKVECQNSCPPVTALPPPTLHCPPSEAVVAHAPGDDCCMYWMCNESTNIHETRLKNNETTTKYKKQQQHKNKITPEPTNTNKQSTTKSPSKSYFESFVPTAKTPSKILGPLSIYANNDDDPNNAVDSQLPHIVSPEENPFYHLTKNEYTGPFNPNFHNRNSVKGEKKVSTTSKIPFSVNENDVIIRPDDNHAHRNTQFTIPHPPLNVQQNDLLSILQNHPELSNLPHGSVLEIHSLTPNVVDKNKPSFINVNGVTRPQNIVPYLVPQPQHPNERVPGVHGDQSNGDVTIEDILHELHSAAYGHAHAQSNRNSVVPNFVAQNPLVAGSNKNEAHILLSGKKPNGSSVSGVMNKGGFSNNNNNNNNYPVSYPNHPGFQQPQDDISVHTLEPVDAHTVRLAFMVPTVIVGLHGRVEVRYTHDADDDDVSSWDLQVFAPPNDLIATPTLEFDLLDLKPDTEYRIKITITLRDLHNTPSSRVYKIKTLKEIQTSTMPPEIPIEPDLAITDINATWVTVMWRKFSEYELQFIDGVQLRYKEIDGKIYAATPLIHRAVTSYTLENLKPNTKYEIGIYFIPFAGQQTELHAKNLLHFSTANEIDTYGFTVSLEISQIKSTSVEISWAGVPYPEDKYVNIYRAIYQSDSGKEDHSTFKIAKRDSPTKSIIMDLKPGTRYRLWLEVYLTNGKIKTSNVQDFITKPRLAPPLGSAASQDKLSRAEVLENSRGDYYGPLVIVGILAALAILSTLILLLILVRRHNQNKAAITPPSTRISQSAYDNPTYKVEIQQETMGL